MTQSELGRSWPLWIGHAGSWGTPPTIPGIRAKSSAGKTPTTGVVSIQGDGLLALSRNSIRQVRNFLLHPNPLLLAEFVQFAGLACLPFLCLSPPSGLIYSKVLLALCPPWERAGGWDGQCIL